MKTPVDKISVLLNWRELWEDLRVTLLHDESLGQGHKVFRALFLMDEIVEREKTKGGAIVLGSFVTDKEDTDLSDLAIVVFDHRIYDIDLFSIKRLSDGHISNRSASELQVVDPLSACKVWCKNQITYSNLIDRRYY